jgi:DNA (cytosine-5)-methyltransferase 1
MSKKIKIIDIFSGPGGLGEGFSAFKNEKGNHPFKIAVSIEKEESAHRTLKLRSFYRQFGKSTPEAYYEFLKGDLGKTPEEELYRLPEFSRENEAADNEALRLELGKDNRKINDQIIKALGQEECILIGGPPCQAYSLAGRSRNQGIKNYKSEEDDRNFLYKEYLRIIARFQPMVFIMENVKGMLSAKVDGKSIYETIFSDLHNPCKAVNIKPKRNYSRHNYKVYSLVTPIEDNVEVKPNDFVIKSELYGIPQRRHRVILLGLREDLNENWDNNLIFQSKPELTLLNAIGDLPKLRSGLSKDNNTGINWVDIIKRQSVDTIKALRKNSDLLIANALEQVTNNIVVPDNGQGSLFGLKRKKNIPNTELSDWYYDKKLGNNICNHDTRGHMASDLQRYLFCSVWAKVGSENDWTSLSPKSSNYPEELMPNHDNFKSGKFADRFRVQPWSIPATTITSHISKDGHYFVHPDPSQCRSLTVREAARIQTFPDNYFFVGNRTQQYVQVGNAVPPLLAKQIAKVVEKILN